MYRMTGYEIRAVLQGNTRATPFRNRETGKEEFGMKGSCFGLNFQKCSEVQLPEMYNLKNLRKPEEEIKITNQSPSVGKLKTGLPISK